MTGLDVIQDVRTAIAEAEALSWKDRAARALDLMRKAQKRGDKKNVAFWKTVYDRARSQPGAKDVKGKAPEAAKGAKGAAATAAGVPTKKPSSEKDAAPDKKSKGAKGKREAPPQLSEKELAALGLTSKDVEGLSPKEQDLLRNKKKRRKRGKKAAKEVKGALGSFLKGALGAVVMKPLKALGGAATAAAGWTAGKVSAADSKTLGRAAGTLVFAALGHLAFGGLGAVAGIALASYFAQRSLRGVSRPVLRAEAQIIRHALLLAEASQDDDEALKAWAVRTLEAIQEGFDDLENMDPRELAAVLRAAHTYEDEIQQGIVKMTDRTEIDDAETPDEDDDDDEESLDADEAVSDEEAAP